jgi:hypothetical protein
LGLSYLVAKPLTLHLPEIPTRMTFLLVGNPFDGLL